MSRKNALDLNGQIFGLLTITKKIGRIKGSSSIYWEAICECGRTTLRPATVFKKLVSCGCTRAELTSLRHRLNGRHCKSRSREYRTWRSMMERCYKEENPSYKHYANILVCERWFDFKNFYSDMGDKPKDMSLGRIDNNGNYEPSNCRWETVAEQNVNRSVSVTPETRKLIIEIMERDNITYQGARHRLKKIGLFKKVKDCI